MIKSFNSVGTKDLFNGINSKNARKDCPKHLWKVAFRKLDMLDSAEHLNDLKIPPGNHLESLKGARKGQHSIRINDQFRICFYWSDTGPENVEIVDYH